MVNGSEKFKVKSLELLISRVLKKVIPLIGIVALLVACANDSAEQKELIQKIDFATYQQYIYTAKSEEEVRKIDSMIFQEIKTTSLNRYLPPISAKDKNNRMVRVDSLISGPTMIVMYSPFSGWSSVDLAEELPRALNGIPNPPNVICLFLNEPDRPEVQLPQDFYKITLEQMSFIYPNFFVIEPGEAQKLNMYALPSRYYTDSEGKLMKLEHGAVSVDRLKKEIKTFLQL